LAGAHRFKVSEIEVYLVNKDWLDNYWFS
jgi:hypothetical protein